jgi:hypothetical protein
MKRPITNQKGFSLPIAFVTVVVVAGLAFAGWYVWKKNQKNDINKTNSNSQSNQSKNEEEPHEEDTWQPVTTQGKAFSMRVPDGWELTNFPNDFLGSMSTVHKPGTPATIKESDTEYVGHTLRFRASITELDDAGLGPQWASPQPGLVESTEDFSLNNLQGKRFKGVFSGDLNQTLYEYVFKLGENKKLDIVYTIYHDEGDSEDILTAEKAIKTIKLND